MYTITSILIIASAIIAQTKAQWDFSDQYEWETFQMKYNKYYWLEALEAYRYGIFQENKHFVEAHNRLFDAGEETYELELNQFADLTTEEFLELFTGYNATDQEFDLNVTYITPAYLQAPSTLDWRQKGAVTPVKYQGQCGSCWAFAATGGLEGQHFRKTGKLVSLSEQNLVDCSGRFGNRGCSGGRVESAYNYIKANGGIDTEASYTYTAKNGRCHFNKKSIGATVRNYAAVPRGNEQKLYEATASQGPIPVAIDASMRSFQLYKGGVYNDQKCNGNRLNHAVLIVGYGNEGGHDYWLVKNSWSARWGDRGYIKIIRNKNRCGIANNAVYPLV